MFNKSIKSFGICFAIFFVLFFSIRLFAEEMGFTELGVFKKWAAYKINDTESCLIQADPSKATGKYKKRGDTFIQIALEESSATSGVISVRAGYNYKEGTDVTLSIGGQNFDLFTHQDTIDTAWSYTHDENNIIKEMRKGTQMIVKGVSTRGTDTKDTYSLYGFTAAYKSALKACKD